jgi:MATE family multidrug resistance protein
MPLVASFQIADGLAGSCGGVLRGQGGATFRNISRGVFSISYRPSASGCLVQPRCILRPRTSDGDRTRLSSSDSARIAGVVDRSGFCHECAVFEMLISSIGQVVALFIVGLGEYAAVWLGTDWEEEVQRGIMRTKATTEEEVQ